MNWLTQKQIKKAAETSDLAAMECSVKHWKQLWQATAGELRKALKEKKTSILTGHCACCHRFYVRGYCRRKCPVRDIGGAHRLCDNTPWDDIQDALWDWHDRKKNWHIWKKAAKAEHEFLLGILEKMKG